MQVKREINQPSSWLGGVILSGCKEYFWSYKEMKIIANNCK